MTDPITDMLTRIRNAQAVARPTVAAPFSKLKYDLAKVLLKQGFVTEIEKKGRKARKVILLTLEYEDKKPKIEGLKRISTPGRRVYCPAKQIRPVRQGRGIRIISTSKGLMTGREAKKKKLGGEVLCEVW